VQHGRRATRDAAERERALMTANFSREAQLREAGPFDLAYERHPLFAWAGMRFARRAGIPGARGQPPADRGAVGAPRARRPGRRRGRRAPLLR
jgi:hypothetical protein